MLYNTDNTHQLFQIQKRKEKIMLPYNHQLKNYETDHNAILSVIKNEISSQLLGPERISIIQDGICFMLSINWIRCLIRDDPTFHDLCDDINNQKNSPNKKVTLTNPEIYYLKQIGNNFCAYAESIRPTVPNFPAASIFDIGFPCTQINVHNFFATNCISKKAKPLSTAPTTALEFTTYFQNVATKYIDAFHLLSLISGTEGHSVAIYQTYNILYFFDCNCGEYTITNLTELFTELKLAYPKLKLTSIYSYTV